MSVVLVTDLNRGDWFYWAGMSIRLDRVLEQDGRGHWLLTTDRLGRERRLHYNDDEHVDRIKRRP